VPLFETIEDCATAPIMRDFYALPGIAKLVANSGAQQDIMLGYSDSNRTAHFHEHLGALPRLDGAGGVLRGQPIFRCGCFTGAGARSDAAAARATTPFWRSRPAR